MPNVPHLSDLETVFSSVVKALLGFAAITVFILFLLGGIKYLISGGDPKAVEGARQTFTYAIYGLLAILFSYLILYLIQTVTGVNITTFTVTRP
jgi:hypothetical protein